MDAAPSVLPCSLADSEVFRPPDRGCSSYKESFSR